MLRLTRTRVLDFDRKTIGFRIKVTRLYKGYSQKQIAIALNCGRSKISKIESGQQEAEASFLFAIAEFLNVEVESFNPKQNQYIDLSPKLNHSRSIKSSVAPYRLDLD
ncbi:MAG: helix-turn-helix domain-containing protein [Waterburya sp.]